MRSRMTGFSPFAQLERQRHGDVPLLGGGLADEELPRLTVVVGEALGAQPHLLALLCIGERAETRSGLPSGLPPEFG